MERERRAKGYINLYVTWEEAAFSPGGFPEHVQPQGWGRAAQIPTVLLPLPIGMGGGSTGVRRAVLPRYSGSGSCWRGPDGRQRSRGGTLLLSAPKAEVGDDRILGSLKRRQKPPSVRRQLRRLPSQKSATNARQHPMIVVVILRSGGTTTT